MALQVWLPLNGDLHNQGLDNGAIFTNISAIWVNGKIGAKSYKCDNSTNNATFPSLTGAKEWSIAYWLYIDTSLTYTIWQDMWTMGYTNATGTASIRDERMGDNTTTHQIIVAKETNVGSNSYNYHSIGNSDKSTNCWGHYVITKTLTHTCLYINGVLYNRIANTLYESTTGTLTGTIKLGNATTGCRLQDFRLYDHCLSPKEVEEIAKGLVLHYKLDLPQPNLLSGNPNTIASWTQDGITLTQETDGSLKCVTSNSSLKRIYNSTSNVWTTVGNKYTVSFMAKAASNGIQIQASRSAMDYAPNITLTTDWKYYKAQIIITATSTAGTLSIQGINNGDIFWLRNVKLENGTIATPYVLPGGITGAIYDSSGYSHNGTIVGELTAAAGSPRYDVATVFNGTDSATQTDNVNIGNIYSISCWLKYNDFNNLWIFQCGTGRGYGSTQFGIHAQNDGAGYGILTNTAYVGITNVSSLTQWHHIVLTFDGTTRKFYFNGELKYSGTVSNALYSGNRLSLGRYYNQNYTSINISDFRIYATVLSLTQIKELYNTSMLVDASGNVSPRELGDLI